MRLSAAKCKMARGRCLSQQAVHQGSVADVALHQAPGRRAKQGSMVSGFAGVGELVQHEHGIRRGVQASGARLLPMKLAAPVMRIMRRQALKVDAWQVATQGRAQMRPSGI